MKKGVLILCLTFTFLFVTKAEDIETTSKLHKYGKYSLDFNFNPAAIFDANSESLFTMSNIRFRMFNEKEYAYRINMGFNYFYNKKNQDNDWEYISNSQTEISLALGLERPLTKTNVRVYYGAELPLILLLDQSKSNVYNENKNSNTRSESFGIGLNAILGIDYNIGRGFYLGVEFNPGLKYVKISDTLENYNPIEKGEEYFSFTTTSKSDIRVGIRF